MALTEWEGEGMLKRGDGKDGIDGGWGYYGEQVSLGLQEAQRIYN